MSATPPHAVATSRQARLDELERRLQEQFGPGLFVAMPRGKFGIEGGGHTFSAIVGELQRQAMRLSNINAVAEELSFDARDEEATAIVDRHRDVFFAPQGGPVWILRNKCVSVFLEKGYCDAILWIDSDMEWTREEMESLRRSYAEHPEYEIFGALVSTRTKDRLPCIYGWDNERKAFPRMNVLPEGDVIDVGGIGAAFTCVRRSLLQRMPPVRDGWYWQVYELSEDLYFATRAVHECGARIGVDTRIRPRHVGLHGFAYQETPDEWQHVRTDMLERMGDAISRYLSTSPTVVDKLFAKTDAPSYITGDDFDEKFRQMVDAFASELQKRNCDNGQGMQADEPACAVCG